MPFNWLNRFQQKLEKPDDYAEKALAAYRLGLKAKGSIVGVRIELGSHRCDQAKQLPSRKMYQPDDAPILPLKGCTYGRKCECIYRPVMIYEVQE